MKWRQILWKLFLSFSFTITTSHDNIICWTYFIISQGLNVLFCLGIASFENNPNLSSSADLLANMNVTSSVVMPEFDIALAKANLGGTVSSTSRENTINVVSNIVRNVVICAIYDLSHIHLYLRHLRVHNELTTWPAPSWLDSLVGRALNRYRRRHGFEPRWSLKFFWLQFLSCFSCVYNCDDQSCLHTFLLMCKKTFSLFSRFCQSYVLVRVTGSTHTNKSDLPSFLLWSLEITATSKHLSCSLSLLWMA